MLKFIIGEVKTHDTSAFEASMILMTPNISDKPLNHVGLFSKSWFACITSKVDPENAIEGTWKSKKGLATVH